MRVVNNVSLRLPTGWIELDPQAPDLLAELERMLDVPEENRDSVVTLLAPLTVELARIAATTDVVLVGMYAQSVSIDGQDKPYVVSGNVVLALSPQVSGMEEVHASLAKTGGEVAPVDLPAGAAVMSCGRTEISDPSWERSLLARVRRYLVPVPGTDRVATLNFLTPNLDLADQFDEVFDAIAQTLEFGYEDVPQPEVASAT